MPDVLADIRKQTPRAHWLNEAYLSERIDTGMPLVRRFFRMDRVKNNAHLNRIYTLELLFQELLPDVAGHN